VGENGRLRGQLAGVSWRVDQNTRNDLNGRFHPLFASYDFSSAEDAEKQREYDEQMPLDLRDGK